MSDFEKLYTVEDIAKMTNLTSRTIRNYLKDGSLHGKKVGGQWRFTMKNIEELFDNGNVTKDIKDNKKQQVLDFIEGVNTDINGEIQVCTIVDYYCEDKNQVKTLCSKLMSVINESGDETKSGAKFDYEYIQEESKARFTLFGTPKYIIRTLQLLEER